MTMTVKGFEKNNGVACVVVSIPVDELFNIPALEPILEQLTAPDVSGNVLQDNSAPAAPAVKKTRKPRQKKATNVTPPVEAAPAVVRHTYPNPKQSQAEKPVKAKKPAKITQAAKTTKPATVEKSNNSNEAKMHSHCPHCKPEQFGTYKQWLAAGYKVKSGQHGVKLMGISEVIENGNATKKAFFFTKFCACQVEAIDAKKVG